MNRIARLLVVLACGAAIRTAGAALSDPAQIMNEAYINLVQGDQSLDAGRLDEALTLYAQAREHYLRLLREFPGFEPRIIQYRKTYCDNQLETVERRLGMAAAPELPPLQAHAPARPAPAPTLVPAAPAAIPAAAPSVELDFLRSRVASLEAEVQELDILQDELDGLAEDNRRLVRELADAQAQLLARAGGDEELETLRAGLAAREEELQALRRDLDARRELDQVLNDMEAKANEMRANADRLAGEIRALDAELDAAEVRAELAERRAQLAEEQLALAEGRVLAAEQEVQVARVAPPAPASPPARDRSRAPIRPPQDSPPAMPKSEPEPAPAPVTAATATVPPRPIPDGMTAPDFIRRLLQEGDNEAALATVQNARRAAAADVNLALIEGIALIRLQRYNEAAALLVDVARRNPRNPEIHATLGAAMMGAGFYDEARETLQMAIRLDKNLPECHYNLAQIYAFIEPINLRLARRHYRAARDFGVSADPQLEQALR